jgi:hypothetical protein
MSRDVEDTPLFAAIAGEETERVLALIADPTPVPSTEELLARARPSATTPRR